MLGGLSKDRKNITLVSRGVVLDHIRNSFPIFTVLYSPSIGMILWEYRTST